MRRKQWVEPVAALLMALATLSTAWCSFQSAAWTRKANRQMNEFNALERKAAEATAKAADSQQQAGAAGSTSGQYLANTVLFAAVLFFANAAGRFEQRRVRQVAFTFALAVFMFAVVGTVMLPH